MGPISIAAQLLAAASSIQAGQKAFSRITLEEKQTIVQYFENADAELNYEILLDSECDAKYVMATNLEQYVILKCSNVYKQSDGSVLFSPNDASEAYLEIDVGSKHIKSISFSFKYNGNYLPEDYIEWKKKGGSWTNCYVPIEMATKSSEVGLATRRAINVPKDANAIRISSNYVEYQRQQIAVSNICVEIG